MATTNIHFSSFKNIESSVVKRVGMRSVTAVAVSAYPVVAGLDVCPPVQENLDGPEAAFLSSPKEGSISILSDIQKDNSSQKKTRKTNILPKPYIHSYFNIFIHTCTYLKRIKIITSMYACMYVCIYLCMIIRFPLHCPGLGYWLLSRRVVPPPQ